MKGSAYCSFRSKPEKAQRFENVNLTFIGSESRAILSRENPDEPEELLCMQEASMDVLSDSSIDLEGFVCVDEDAETYHKCFVTFVFTAKEAA